MRSSSTKPMPPSKAATMRSIKPPTRPISRRFTAQASQTQRSSSEPPRASRDSRDDGLAVDPLVEAFAGLLAELPCADHRAQDRRRPELLADLFREVVEDRQADVEPDEVGELERAHR